MKKRFRAVVYARVSSREQKKRNTIESQLRELPTWAERLDIEVVGTYVDNGISGAALLERRQGLLGLLERIRLGDITHVIVLDLDRFTRHVSLRIRGQILGGLQDSKVIIAELSSGAMYDLGTFEGRIAVQTKVELAAQWLETHIQRVKIGQATARTRGWKPGGRTPYGLSFDKISGFTVNKEEKAVLEEIFRRILGGQSYEGIARVLNDRGVPSGTMRAAVRWSKAHVWRLARHADYLITGQWKHGGVSLAVPQVIAGDLWDEVQRTLGRKVQIVRIGEQRVYLAQGLGVCGLCGARMRTLSNSPRWGRQYQYYVCGTRHWPRHERDRCSLPYHRADQADERLWNAVVDLFGDRWHEYRDTLRRTAAAALDGQRDLARALREAQAELARLDGVEAALLARFGDGDISKAGLDNELARLARKRATARDELTQAEQGLGIAALDLDALERVVEAARHRLPGAPLEMRRQLVQELIPGTGKYCVTFGIKGQIRATVAISALAFHSVISPSQWTTSSST